jgi:hypothetical protein
MAQQVKHRKRRMLNCSFVFGNDTDEGVYESFWETDMSGGVGGFLFIDQPTTYPSRAWWMMFTEPEMAKPRTNLNTRTVNLMAQEQGPHFLALGV